jgi:hypothetical protein
MTNKQMKRKKWLCLLFLSCTYSLVSGQVITLPEILNWLKSDEYPNVVFESLEDKKFKHISSVNFIRYGLEKDIESYLVETPDGEHEILDTETDKLIKVSREITFSFFGSQKHEYTYLKNKIKESCRFVKRDVRTFGKVTFSSNLFEAKSPIRIKVDDGFLSERGMFYSITFYIQPDR